MWPISDVILMEIVTTYVVRPDLLKPPLWLMAHLVSLQSGINPHCLWNCVIHLSVWSSSPYPHGLPPSVCKSFFQVSFCFFQCTPVTFSTHVLFFLHIQILGVCFFFSQKCTLTYFVKTRINGSLHIFTCKNAVFFLNYLHLFC